MHIWRRAVRCSKRTVCSSRKHPDLKTHVLRRLRPCSVCVKAVTSRAITRLPLRMCQTVRNLTTVLRRMPLVWMCIRETRRCTEISKSRSRRSIMCPTAVCFPSGSKICSLRARQSPANRRRRAESASCPVRWRSVRRQAGQFRLHGRTDVRCVR